MTTSSKAKKKRKTEEPVDKWKERKKARGGEEGEGGLGRSVNRDATLSILKSGIGI